MSQEAATTHVPLTDQAYADLLAFRTEMRRFMRWSEERAQDEAMTHMQHQLLLVVRAHDDPRGPTIGEAAGYLLTTLSTASELVDAAESGGYLRRRRSDQDGRVVRLSLTQAGRRKVERLTRLVLAELARLAPVLEQVVADATRLEAERSGGVGPNLGEPLDGPRPPNCFEPPSGLSAN